MHPRGTRDFLPAWVTRTGHVLGSLTSAGKRPRTGQDANVPAAGAALASQRRKVPRRPPLPFGSHLPKRRMPASVSPMGLSGLSVPRICSAVSPSGWSASSVRMRAPMGLRGRPPFRAGAGPVAVAAGVSVSVPMLCPGAATDSWAGVSSRVVSRGCVAVSLLFVSVTGNTTCVFPMPSMASRTKAGRSRASVAVTTSVTSSVTAVVSRSASCMSIRSCVVSGTVAVTSGLPG